MKQDKSETITCPICYDYRSNHLGEHIRKEHGEEALRRAVLEAKKSGMPDFKIGEIFGISFKQLEKFITEAYGINISALKKPKKIKYWEPKDFREETTTVWSYKKRGDWATHDSRYRGNWSPYIPRNIILKYSKPGEVVLDYFVGGGTTAIEAKLLGRRCIAKDINPACVVLTKENIKFNPPKTLFKNNSIFEPEVYVGDARNLSEIGDNSIDLICAHPPYAGIITYSSKVEGDLSRLEVDEFLEEMKKVAQESFRVLKPGKKCAILIGDTRKKKHIVPIGFRTINVFLDVGFKLKELVIKRQHNCKTTGFWYKKSIKDNFLLLAHEYLPIFEKPEKPKSDEEVLVNKNLSFEIRLTARPIEPETSENCKLETTSVWVFPSNDYEKYLNSNVIRRYSKGKDYQVISIDFENSSEEQTDSTCTETKHLLFIKSPLLSTVSSQEVINSYLWFLKDLINIHLKTIKPGGFIVIHTKDVRVNEYVEPLAKKIVDLLTSNKLWLKEIIIVTQENLQNHHIVKNNNLEIIHQYLLVYEVLE